MLKNKKLFLLDIDGTICKGNQLIAGSASFLKNIKANGGQFVFITKDRTTDWGTPTHILPNMRKRTVIKSRHFPESLI